MKPHPRIRKAIKWGGAAVTVLLVVVWIGSGWWYFTLRAFNHGATVEVGKIVLTRDRGERPNERRSVAFGSVPSPQDRPRWNWGFRTWRASMGPYAWSGIDIPMWCPTVLMVAVTAAAWRLDILAQRRARLNLCPKCRYDRIGLATGAKCPECGTGGAAAA